MLIFRVFTDAGEGGVSLTGGFGLKPSTLGYSFRCAFTCFARRLMWLAVRAVAVLSRAAHGWRWGGEVILLFLMPCGILETTSPLRGTPPFHCVAGGELGCLWQ